MGARNLEWMLTCSVFLFCLSLALIPGSANALPSAESTFEIDWSTLDINIQGNLTITDRDGTYKGLDMNGTYSKAKVESNPDASDKQKVEEKEQKKIYENTQFAAGIKDTTANAHTTYGGTTASELSGSVYAKGGSGIKNKAESYAEQWVYFNVEGTGTGILELSVDYYLKQALDVEAADEWAKAKTEVWLEIGELWFELDGITGKEKEEWDWDKDKQKIDWKKTWGDFNEEFEESGTLTARYDFEAGDLGYIWLVGKNKVEAYKAPPSPVPEPATMLFLGSGLICLAGFRRKLKK